MKRPFNILIATILSNKGLKVLSVFIAIICWYSIHEVMNFDNQYNKLQGTKSSNSSRQCFTRSLPIKTLISSELQFDMRICPETVLVSFESIGANPSPPSSISALIDCYGITASGEYSLPVRCISTSNTRIIEVSPPYVIVYVDSFKRRNDKPNQNKIREN